MCASSVGNFVLCSLLALVLTAAMHSTMEDYSHAKSFAQTMMDPEATGNEPHYAIFSVFDGHG